MDTIGMAPFIDFALTPATGNVAIAAQIEQGGYPPDRYADLCVTIAEMHRDGHDVVALDSWLSVQPTTDKRRLGAILTAYKRFCRAHELKWFEPPMRDLPLGHGINVRVAPELGVLIDGRPHAIKLYFRSDPITPSRLALTTALMHHALSTTWPGTVCAVLDVRRGKLLPHVEKAKANKIAFPALKGAAASFAEIVRAL